MPIIALIFLGVITPILGGSLVGNCPSNELVRYKVTLVTLWNKKDFPKQYPDHRPNAQWSKLTGVTHNRDIQLYEPGDYASPALKEVAETGQTNLLDLLTQGEPGVLDVFRTPPIPKGVGEATSHFFVDGNHSRVSLVSRIIPSPDWFIGVNGYDLCAGGHWVDTVNIKLEPLDAGTDRGLTFTSPNWPSKPAERIHTITAQYPDHQAGSFYYPELNHLPPIAKITFVKEREYTMTRPYDLSDADINEVFSVDDITIQKLGGGKQEKNRVPYLTQEDKIDFGIPKLDNKAFELEEVGSRGVEDPMTMPWLSHKRHRTKHRLSPVDPDAVTEPGLHNNLFADATDSQELLRNKESNDISQHKNHRNLPKKTPIEDEMVILDDIVKKMKRDKKKKLRKQRKEEKLRRRLEMKKIKPPRDCRVSEWSDWSPCSKTCGIGEQTKTRRILKHARRGGRQCPDLKQTTWCGSARDCKRVYFNW